MNPPGAELQNLLRQAEDAQRSGRQAEAAAVFERILVDDPGERNALQFLSGFYFSGGDYERAARYLRGYHEIEPSSADCLHALGLALGALGQHEEALPAFRRALAIDPGDGKSWLYLGACLESLGDGDKAVQAYTLAVDRKPNLKHLHAHGRAPEPVRRCSVMAEARLSALGHELHGAAVEAAGAAHPDADLTRAAKALWRKLHSGEVPFQDMKQQPMDFYMPGLDCRPWFERHEFAWMATLEAECEAIRDEVRAHFKPDRDTVPYIGASHAESATWRRLSGSREWSAMHIYNGGRGNAEAMSMLPHTTSVIDGLPLFKVGGRPIEALLSVLEPGIHIPPHFGMTNARLTVHLPLVVPDGCGVRAGTETRATEYGQCLIFDDSFEHEAWNKSDETRIVLIVEAWHPDLTEAERTAVEASFAAYEEWMTRRNPGAIMNG